MTLAFLALQAFALAHIVQAHQFFGSASSSSTSDESASSFSSPLPLTSSTTSFTTCPSTPLLSQLWNFTSSSAGGVGQLRSMANHSLCLVPESCGSSTSTTIVTSVCASHDPTNPSPCEAWKYDTFTFFTFTNGAQSLLMTDNGPGVTATVSQSNGNPSQQFMFTGGTGGSTIVPAANPALCLASSSSQQQQQQQQDLTVDFGSIIREDYLGVCAVRHGFDYMPEETYRGLNDTYRLLNYQRLQEARVTGVRTWYASEWVMPGGWGTPLNFSTPRFEAFALWMNDMKQLNISVLMNAGWWFTENTCASGPPANCTPTSASVDIYTNFISATVRELVVNRNLTNLKTLLLFTEALQYPAGIVPANYTQETFYFYTIRALHNKMVADGTRDLVKFLGPNDGGLSTPIVVTALNDTITNLDDVLDIYSSHDYDMPSYTRWENMFLSATNITNAYSKGNKPFWVDEGGAGPESVRNNSEYGTYVSLWHTAAMNAGASSTWIWLWADQYYVWPLENVTNDDSFENGLHRWGLSFWTPNSTQVRPGYYAYTILSRFLRAPQGADYATSVSVIGSQPGDGCVGAAIMGTAGSSRAEYRAIVLVNEGNSTAMNVNVSFVDSSSNSHGNEMDMPPMSRYLYDPANVPTDLQPIGPSGSYPGGSVLTDTIPPRGVVVWASAWEG